MQMNFDALAAALAELDFSGENEAIAAIDAKVTEIETACLRAEERRRQISQALSDYDKPDGKAVAARLLDGEEATDAAAVGQSRDALFAERQALTEAIRELNWQGQDLREEVRKIEERAAKRTAEAAAPYAEAILDQARAAIASLPETYAALVALTSATGVGAGDAERLRRTLETTHGSNRLVPTVLSAQVPDDLAAALRPLAYKGRALSGARFIASVGMP